MPIKLSSCGPVPDAMWFLPSFCAILALTLVDVGDHHQRRPPSWMVHAASPSSSANVRNNVSLPPRQGQEQHSSSQAPALSDPLANTNSSPLPHRKDAEDNNVVETLQSPTEVEDMFDPSYQQPGSGSAQSAATKSNGAGSDHGSGGEGGWFGKILGGKKHHNSNHLNHDRQASLAAISSEDSPEAISATATITGVFPPPPPPPPIDTAAMKQQVPPFPPNTHDNHGYHYDSNSYYSPNLHPHASNNYNYNMYGDNPTYADPNNNDLAKALDESTLREMTLTHQLHNLTSLHASLTAECESLTLRIDVLTERLADTTSNLNFVHNRNLEYVANCTSLLSQVAALEKKVVDKEEEADHLRVQQKEDAAQLGEVRTELRRVTDELEQLACLVEKERFQEEGESLRMNKVQKQAYKRKRKVGFWARLFGFDHGDIKRSVPAAPDMEERHRAARDLARSSLLHALQNERANVEELESNLATLQRNNSALAQVVDSRDSLVKELNDRVAVFEEDKMVLKAALRQLQLEIREEEPRTEELARRLDEAQQREELLSNENEDNARKWEEERIELEGTVEDLQRDRNNTKEQLELIELYVDQLEDRLAGFALARKELEVKEAECKSLQEDGAAKAEEVKALMLQVEELKPLLEDLMEERTRSQASIQTLTERVNELKDQIKEWKARLVDTEQRNDDLKSQSTRQLFLVVEEGKQKIEEERLQWEKKKELELQQILEQKQQSWEVRSASDWKRRLAQEKTEFERQLEEQRRKIKLVLEQEHEARMERHSTDLRACCEAEAQRKLDEERLSWDARLREEKKTWESEALHAAAIAAAAEAAAVTSRCAEEDTALKAQMREAMEQKVERAAEKVYTRLEQNGLSYGGSVTAMADFSPCSSALEVVRKGLLSGNTPSEAEDEDSGGERNDKRSEIEDRSRNADDVLSIYKDKGDENQLESSTLLSKSNSDHDDRVEVNYSSSSVPFQTQRQQQQFSTKARSGVPLRAMRKVFSRVTGLHGLITPSTMQLRRQQRKNDLNKRHKQQMQQGLQENVMNGTKLENSGSMANDAARSESTKVLQEDDLPLLANTEMLD